MLRLLATNAQLDSVCSAASTDTASVHQIENASVYGTFMSRMRLEDDKWIVTRMVILFMPVALLLTTAVPGG